MKHAFIAMLAVLCCLAPPLVRARRRTDWVNDQGETCVMSACEEHWPGLHDSDCCGMPGSTWCGDGYTKKNIDDGCMQGLTFGPQSTCCTLVEQDSWLERNLWWMLCLLGVLVFIWAIQACTAQQKRQQAAEVAAVRANAAAAGGGIQMVQMQPQVQVVHMQPGVALQPHGGAGFVAQGQVVQAYPQAVGQPVVQQRSSSFVVSQGQVVPVATVQPIYAGAGAGTGVVQGTVLQGTVVSSPAAAAQPVVAKVTSVTPL